MYIYRKIPGLSEHHLDIFLKKGWFRVGQEMVTLPETAYVFPGIHYWLRIDTEKVTVSKSYKKRARLLNNLEYRISDWYIDDEIEQLYKQYSANADFEMNESVTESLLTGSDINIFNTQTITIRSGKQLIAAGYFDKGKESIAAILHIYHPAFKKMGPGKLLLQIELEYCRLNRIKYHYPGYLKISNSKMEYKLLFGKEATEVLIPFNGGWIPLGCFDKQHYLDLFFRRHMTDPDDEIEKEVVCLLFS